MGHAEIVQQADGDDRAPRAAHVTDSAQAQNEWAAFEATGGYGHERMHAHVDDGAYAPKPSNDSGYSGYAITQDYVPPGPETDGYEAPGGYAVSNYSEEAESGVEGGVAGGVPPRFHSSLPEGHWPPQ